MNHTQEQLFKDSQKIIPGGVHSPVRSFKGLHTTPRFIDKADGAYIYDVDQNKYIDFCMSFGPLILGHKNKIVQDKLVKALDNGWTFGTCEKYSLNLAQELINKIDFIEQIRFVNSGTEAVMTALRLARGVTNKDKIIKFNGCYHGHTDSMLIKAGSGLAGEAESSSAGVPKSISKDTIIIELGDKEAVINAYDKYKNEIAAIIIEPLPANNGLLVQDKEFLSFLRDISKDNDSLLIFDEVISGLRVSIGGMSEKLNITPDIVTYGKIIGGGLPVGAVAGNKFIMEHLAPIGNVYQAGTLSGNPLAMVAGLSTISQLTPPTYKKIEDNTQKIIATFSKWLKEYDNGKYSDFNILNESSLFWLAPGDDIDSIDKIPKNLTEKFKPLYETLLNKGVYLSPNAYEVGFVSLAHDEKVIEDLNKRLWSEVE